MRNLSVYEQAALEVGTLVTEKQKAYGDSFGRSGEVLRQLYPDGIQPHQYDDLLTIARVLDKLFRIATDPNAFNEDPDRDTMGYMLLRLVKNRKKRAEFVTKRSSEHSEQHAQEPKRVQTKKKRAKSRAQKSA